MNKHFIHKIASLPPAEPTPELDARVLNHCHRLIRTQAKQRQRSLVIQRAFYGIAAALILCLCGTAVLHTPNQEDSDQLRTAANEMSLEASFLYASAELDNLELDLDLFAAGM